MNTQLKLYLPSVMQNHSTTCNRERADEQTIQIQNSASEDLQKKSTQVHFGFFSMAAAAS